MLGSLIALLISILLVGLTASTGARFRPDSWYRELSKPSWTPPDIAFPIAWGILYLLMARVIVKSGGWRSGGSPV